MYDFTNVDPVKCCTWLVLPTVYDESLSYGEQLNKFCKALNELIENNNNIPKYVSEMIQDYITSGAIDEVVRNILANYILNVKYPPKGITPAVGDGSADDTDAIQGCIDYAFNQGGGCVYFPYGKYLSRSLTLRSGVSLVGFDRYSTRIVQRGGDTKPLISGGNVQNVQISNLTLDGNNEVQTDDLDVVNVLGKDCLFTNLIIKSGFQCFVYNGLGGDLQVDNVVFGGAVKKVAVINGKDSVQFTNVKFNELGKVQGECVLEVGASDGIYSFSSKAISPLCISVSGNRNTFNCDIVNASSNFNDTGVMNNFNVLGVEVKEQLAHGKNISIGGNTTENITGSKTETVGTGKVENITGSKTETIGSGKVENITGSKTETIGSGKVENITGSKTEVISENREINVNGNDSIRVNGITTINRGGAVTEEYNSNRNVNVVGSNTEVYNSIRNVKVSGTNTETYEDTSTENYKSKKIINAKDIGMSAESFIIQFPNKKVDLANISQISVFDYGAKGDGIHDDSGAIMSMIEAFGYAFFKPGTYKCNLTLNNTCSLVGTSYQTTILEALDNSKDVITVNKTAPYTSFYGLTMQNGINGLHIIDGIGNNIDCCIFRLNSNSGLFIDGKNTDINSILTHITRCYSERNGKYGYLINNYPDWSMSDCEGVSNASSMNATDSTNLKVINCAGKVVNSHFWNFNDNLKFYRPHTSVDINSSSVEFTNCHIEGGYDSNLSISNKSNPVFVNCTIYASFGAISIWLDDSPYTKFIGCYLYAQAGDNVSYKPDWQAIFGGGSTNGTIIASHVQGNIFTNKNFTSWNLDIFSDSHENILSNIDAYTDLRIRGGLAYNVNLNTSVIGGGSDIDMSDKNGAWLNTSTATLKGYIYPGKTFLLGNGGNSACTVTVPITLLDGSKTLTIPAKKTVLLYFADTLCYCVGL